MVADRPFKEIKMKTVTITIAGLAGTGKTFVKYHIVKHLQELGLKVNVDQNDETVREIANIFLKEKEFVDSLNEHDIIFNVQDKQLARDLTSKSEKYFTP